MQEQDFKLKYLHGAAIMLVIYDMIAVNLSYLVGLWLRFDLQFSHIESKYIGVVKIHSDIYPHNLDNIYCFQAV